MTAAFHRWLAQARRTDSPSGDAIYDMRHDKDLPADIPDWSTLRNYVTGTQGFHISGSADVLRAVHEAWRRYEKWQRKQA